jgi:hypothetical protein
MRLQTPISASFGFWRARLQNPPTLLVQTPLCCHKLLREYVASGRGGEAGLGTPGSAV